MPASTAATSSPRSGVEPPAQLVQRLGHGGLELGQPEMRPPPRDRLEAPSVQRGRSGGVLPFGVAGATMAQSTMAVAAATTAAMDGIDEAHGS